MDLVEAARKLKDEKVSLARRKSDLAAEMDAVDRDDAALTVQLKAIEEVAQRFDLRIDDNESDLRWLGFKRQEAVFQALREINGAAHLQEILDLLRAKGRTDDNVDLISAALSSLRSKDQVEPTGQRGIWRITMPSAIRQMADDTNSRLHGGLQLPASFGAGSKMPEDAAG
jgi:hypothetical protein